MVSVYIQCDAIAKRVYLFNCYDSAFFQTVFCELSSEFAGPGYGLAWCTGGPGIALARGRLLQLLPEHDQAGQWLGELRAGADAAAAAPLLSTDHLCCGNLGLVAILRTLAGQVGEPGWAAAADRTEAAVLGRLGELPRSQLGGGAEGIPIPGLMTGLAGVPLALNSEPGRWVSALLL